MTSDKAGERDTVARRIHLDLHLSAPSPPVALEPPAMSSSEPQTERERAALPPRVAEPGMSDEAIRRGTGKPWDDWFRLLDAWQAGNRSHSHREITHYLAAEHGIGGWWAQSVTVGYERARGLRAVHQRPDGFSANVSKTFPVPVEQLFAAVVDETRRDRWLEPGTLRLRTVQSGRSARFDLPADGTRLDVTFTAKGPAKTSVAFQHNRLISAEDVAARRTFWRAHLDRLATILAIET